MISFEEYNKREELYNDYSNKERGEKVYKDFYMFDKVYINNSTSGIIVEYTGTEIKIMQDASKDFATIGFDRENFEKSISKTKTEPIMKPLSMNPTVRGIR